MLLNGDHPAIIAENIKTLKNQGHDEASATKHAHAHAAKGKGPMIKPSHKGRLHKALGVPEGQPIPAGKIAAAEHSDNPHMRQMANFADNAKSFNH